MIKKVLIVLAISVLPITSQASYYKDTSWSNMYSGTDSSYSGTTSWSYQREGCFDKPKTDEYSTVPIPGAVFLFGTALMGFVGFKRLNKK